MDKGLTEKLQPLREKIDALDAQILALLNQRAGVALEVGQLKTAVDEHDSIIKLDREAAIIRKLQNDNNGPFPAQAIQAVWREIISACRGLERVPVVAYLGPKGSFSEQAAFAYFGHSIERVPCNSFDEVFRAVEAGQAQLGIVPVENSTEGAVNRSLDLLLNTSLKVVGEYSLDIHHCLLSQSGTMEGVQQVLAHPQALAQCQSWLNRHYPGLECAAAPSNSEAARLASEDATVAAIAGEVAAQEWGLGVVAARIQDDALNRTRFLAIANLDNPATGHDKTSIILAVPNRAGAVYEMLAPLAENGVSMTRLESRPARTGQWEYYFYIDFLGHQSDAKVQKALAVLQERAAFFKVLGSYPAQ